MIFHFEFLKLIFNPFVDPCKKDDPCKAIEGTEVDCHAMNYTDFKCHYKCKHNYHPIEDDIKKGCKNPCQEVGCKSVETNKTLHECESKSEHSFVCHYDCCSTEHKEDCERIWNFEPCEISI